MPKRKGQAGQQQIPQSQAAELPPPQVSGLESANSTAGRQSRAGCEPRDSGESDEDHWRSECSAGYIRSGRLRAPLALPVERVTATPVEAWNRPF